MKLPFLLKLVRAIETLRAHEHWTRPQVLAHQAAELARLRAYALARSPFYRRFHHGRADQPLAELPVLTKALLMEHFDELVTDPAVRLADVRAYAAQPQPPVRFREHYWVSATSGSTGQPGFFLFDEAEWVSVIASFARAQDWSGLRINLRHRRRLATVASTSPWHLSSQMAATVRTPWTPSLRLPATDPLPVLVERLNAWQPDLLIGYATMAGDLAAEQLAGRLSIHPARTFTSAEVLTPETRRRVRAAWGDEPYDQYGATETGDLAAEYHRCRRMHLFEDLLIFEAVDEQGRPVPPGTYAGRLLVTVLFSRTLPLIRYELSDSVRLAAGACACGLPFGVLEGIQGRVEEALSLPAGAGARVTIQPLTFKQVMDLLPVHGWQVAQAADDSLTVLIAGASAALDDVALETRLRAVLTEHGAWAPRLRVVRVAAIPKSPAGKTPQIKAYRPGAPEADEALLSAA